MFLLNQASCAPACRLFTFFLLSIFYYFIRILRYVVYNGLNILSYFLKKNILNKGTYNLGIKQGYCYLNITIIIYNILKQIKTREGGGAEAPWSPQKWSPSLRICRITSRPRKTGLPASVTSPSLPLFCLHTPHFGSNKKIFGFYFHQEPFFKKFSTWWNSSEWYINILY